MTTAKIILLSSLVLTAIVFGFVFIQIQNHETRDSDRHQVEEPHTHSGTETHTHVEEEPDHEESAKELSSSPVIDSPYFGEYTLQDSTFGTQVAVTLTGDTRTISANSLPNHTHGEFPGPGNPNEIAAIEATYTLPLTPTYAGVTKDARKAIIGINGIPFEPGTAERVTCSSGEEYRVAGLQDLMDLGMDMNNAHVQPTGLYHYHGSPTGLIEFADQGNDLVHIGFAFDGHMVYYSKSGAYSSSYALSTSPRSGTDCVISGPRNQTMTFEGTIPDGSLEEDWEYLEGTGDLDECNGIMIDGTYAYLVTEEYPFIGRCLMGEFTEETPRGGGQPGGRPQPRS